MQRRSQPRRLTRLLLLGVLLEAGRALAEPAAPGPAPTAAPPPAAPAGPAAPAAPASAPVEYAVEGGGVVAVAGAERRPLPALGPALAVERIGDELHVAQGTQGVATFDVTRPLEPRLVARVPLQGSATGFRRVDGELWVLVVSRSAIPLPSGAGGGAAAPATPAAAAPRASAGDPPAVARGRGEGAELHLSVRPAGPGRVTLQGEGLSDLSRGARLAILRRVDLPDGEGGAFQGEELVGTAEILAHREGHALAALSRGSDAREGDVARIARDSEQRTRAFPFRVVEVAEASLILRPIVHAGSPLGVGVLAEAEGTYLGQDYFAGVRIAPLGLGWTDRGHVIVTSALAEGGYDGAALAAGLGVGVSWVAGNLDHMLESWGSSSMSDSGSATGGPEITRRQPTNTALTLSQVARLGARDGLHLSLRNLLLFHEDPDTGENGFIYGGTSGQLTIPVAELSDIQIDGGGGVMGYWMVGFGVGTWIRGNGGPGSLRLSLSAGAAGVHGSREVKETSIGGDGQPYTYEYDEDVDVAGPMVSAGITRRFEL